MKIKLYGTRGSIPISNKDSVIHGGNTTCLRIFDDAIPNNMALIIDSGSGFVPLSKDILKDEKITDIFILYTHYHIDHTLGLFLSPLTFIKHYNITVLGPLENDMGGREMMENLMISPYFPVDIREVKSHFEYKAIKTPNARVIIIGKEGFTAIDMDHYDLLVKHNEYIPIGKGKFPLEDCLIIKMFKTNHPEKTLSYSMVNNKTKEKFVFLTDHENHDGISRNLLNHLKDANLAIMDCQYSRKKYDANCGGFGHATPDYCVRLAEHCGVKSLGLTHHDPDSTDADIDNILAEAKECLKNKDIKIFTCKDYQEIEL